MSHSNGNDVLGAIHEAGHVIVGQRLNLHAGHGFSTVTIETEGDSGGKANMHMPENFRTDRLEDFVCMLSAGMAASELFMKDVSMVQAIDGGGRGDREDAVHAIIEAGRTDETKSVWNDGYKRAKDMLEDERLLLRWIASFLLHYRTIQAGTVHMLFRAFEVDEAQRVDCFRIAAAFQLPENEGLSIEEFAKIQSGMTTSDMPGCPVQLLDDVRLSAGGAL